MTNKLVLGEGGTFLCERAFPASLSFSSADPITTPGRGKGPLTPPCLRNPIDKGYNELWMPGHHLAGFWQAVHTNKQTVLGLETKSWVRTRRKATLGITAFMCLSQDGA